MMNKKQMRIVRIVALLLIICSLVIGLSSKYVGGGWLRYVTKRPEGFIFFVFMVPTLIIGGLLFHRAKNIDNPKQ